MRRRRCLHRANDDQTLKYGVAVRWRFVTVALFATLPACNAGEARLVVPNDVRAGESSTSSYSVVHSFQGPLNDGYVPMGGLVADSSGDLYGVTNYGGSYAQTCNAGVGCGTFFTLDPSSLKETVLHSFGKTQKDSALPSALFLHNGSFYGTAQTGGVDNGGTVFELAPTRKGQGWKETILHSFHYGHHDGSDPDWLTFDSAGAIYGTALAGGSSTTCALGCGAIFELVPPTSGKNEWRETILHSFTGPEGSVPDSLVIAGDGTLYGEAAAGGRSSTCGNSGCGTVFALKRGSRNSRWIVTTLHSFTETEGSFPYGGLIPASNGTFYGVASYGGVNDCRPGSPRTGCGTFFSLQRRAEARMKWTESTLYDFAGGPNDGDAPDGIVSDGGRGFYGETANGGAGSCRYNGAGCGTLFHLKPARHRAKWTERIEHSFSGGSSDGWDPGGAPAPLGKNVYGVTQYGGSGRCSLGCGTIYEFQP